VDEARLGQPFVCKVFVETERRIGGPTGWLSVYRGTLILQPSPSCQRLTGLRSELRHSTPAVLWIRQRLFPPWLNLAIDFRDDTSEEIIRLRPRGSARRGLRPALVAAGFEVVDQSSKSILFGP
jgi:hypothetical protein